MNSGVWVGLAVALVGVASIILLVVQQRRLQKRFDQTRAVLASQTKELREESVRQSAAQERIASALEILVADRKPPQP